MLAANLARGADWFCVAELMSASGGATGCGRDQELVDAIIQLGHLPTQSKNASAEEKRLAVRLIRARKAGSLSSEQEAALGRLPLGAEQVSAGSGWQY